jgi:hypothetical protein
MPPVPDFDPCPPVSQPPLIKSDDSEIETIFSQSTDEITSVAAHANLEETEDESQSGFVGEKSIHHAEHYYSGPVTKETVGHPAIDLIVEDLG